MNLELYATFTGSAALRESEGADVNVAVYLVPGGYAFAIVGGFANAAPMVAAGCDPFESVAAALAVANDPDSPNCSEL